MYEVRIDADPDEFLDWDEPLSEQSELVRSVYAALRESSLPAGAEGLDGANSALAEALRGAGIKGLRYLDEGSRASGEGGGTDGIRDAGEISAPAFFTPRRDLAEGYGEHVIEAEVPEGDLLVDLDMPGARLMSPEDAAASPDGTASPDRANRYMALLKRMGAVPDDPKATPTQKQLARRAAHNIRAALGMRPVR
ncbi:hypothetical protein HNP73_000997 [Amaricoccus macauensis]|uniref:Uncharacterized protein n=1 Tax=Amaricoccus macauensis TaxID=57001 RepID=A0A840SMH9_9RHOB|nr:hypothetical protein [Amaricoccus macauensis]MBB5221076.1 hypothetical protein [Amaricoccus macauensis]